jgi:hypothetical protein
MLDLISFETKPKWGGIPVCFPGDNPGLPYRLGYVKIQPVLRPGAAFYYLRYIGFEAFHS